MYTLKNVWKKAKIREKMEKSQALRALDFFRFFMIFFTLF